MSDGQYFLLDVETSKRMDLALWWASNSKGYTTTVDRAGRYSKAEATAIANPSYGSTKMIPCEFVEPLVKRVVNMDDLRDAERKVEREQNEAAGKVRCEGCEKWVKWENSVADEDGVHVCNKCAKGLLKTERAANAG